MVELVFALKKWEVVAHDGKETFKIIANIEMYWTDDRMIGFPTHHKPMPENIWRPQLNGCAGFDLGKAENYEQLPRFYGYDSTQEHKPSDGRMAQTFPGVNLKDRFILGRHGTVQELSFRQHARGPVHRVFRRETARVG